MTVPRDFQEPARCRPDVVIGRDELFVQAREQLTRGGSVLLHGPAADREVDRPAGPGRGMRRRGPHRAALLGHRVGVPPALPRPRRPLRPGPGRHLRQAARRPAHRPGVGPDRPRRVHPPARRPRPAPGRAVRAARPRRRGPRPDRRRRHAVAGSRQSGAARVRRPQARRHPGADAVRGPDRRSRVRPPSTRVAPGQPRRPLQPAHPRPDRRAARPPRLHRPPALHRPGHPPHQRRQPVLRPGARPRAHREPGPAPPRRPAAGADLAAGPGAEAGWRCCPRRPAAPSWWRARAPVPPRPCCTRPGAGTPRPRWPRRPRWACSRRRPRVPPYASRIR